MDHDKLIRRIAEHGESSALAVYHEDDGTHGWNHPQCYPCWFNKWGLDREPARYKHGGAVQPCCYCGRPTASGIYLRERPGSGIIPYCPDARIDRSLFRDPSSPPRS